MKEGREEGRNEGRKEGRKQASKMNEPQSGVQVVESADASGAAAADVGGT